jgi:hypothetical protein
MVDNAEECIVMMEAAGVRMNVSFEVQNDDETMYLRLHGFPISSVHVMMSAMMSRLPSGKSSV